MVVLVLLGVLAAVGIPLYVNLKGNAHKSAVAETAAAFKTAVQMVRLAYIVSGLSGAVDNVPRFGSGDVDVNSFGYPVDTSNANTLNAARCVRVWNGILTQPPRAATAVASDPDYLVTHSGQICTYTYRRDTVVRRFSYNALTGAVVVTNP